MKDKHEQITTQINRNGHTVVSYVKKIESSYCRWWFKKKKTDLWDQRIPPGKKCH